MLNKVGIGQPFEVLQLRTQGSMVFTTDFQAFRDLRFLGMSEVLGEAAIIFIRQAGASAF